MKSPILYILCIKQKNYQKVHYNIMISINIQYTTDTIFMNSGNSKISDPHRLLNLSDKIDLHNE